MENLKNSPGKGPQYSYLKKVDKEIFMSPEYFKQMSDVSKGLESRLRLRGDGMSGARDKDYERSYKSLKYNREKNDIWSLGATILYAGNLESIRPIYNEYQKRVDEEQLKTMIGKFEGRYGESVTDAAGIPTPGSGSKGKLVETVKRMLAYDESDRPSFAELKKDIAPDLELHDTFDDAEFNPDVEDPFKDLENGAGYDYGQKQKQISYREMEHMMMNRIAEHPEHGGVFGLQNGYRGRRKQGKLGMGHTGITQAKVMESMEYVNPRNNDLFQRNYNFVPTYGEFGETQQQKGREGDGMVNRRYFV